MPTPEEARLARESGRVLAALRGEGEVARLRILGADQEFAVPVSALRMLVEILDQMAEGKTATVVAVGPELTTQQAADLLNVSRPHVVALLERNALPYRTVGAHRRVLLKDLVEFRERSRIERGKALDDLAKQTQDMGSAY